MGSRTFVCPGCRKVFTAEQVVEMLCEGLMEEYGDDDSKWPEPWQVRAFRLDCGTCNMGYMFERKLANAN